MKKEFAIAILILFTQQAFPQTAGGLNDEGIALAKRGKIDKAFSIFNRAIALYPNQPGAYANRGNIYRMREEYALAVQDYSTALALNPDNLVVLYARANTHMDARNFDRAIADYSTIIAKKPSFSDIYFDRAYAYIKLEKYEEAKSDLEAQLEVKPKDFKSLANLITIKKKLELFDEALTGYQQLVSKFPNQPDLHIIYNNWAVLYSDIGRQDDALVKINQALKVKRNYVIGLFTRACIYLELGEEKNACKDFKKALKLNLTVHAHFEIDEDYEKLKKLCD